MKATDIKGDGKLDLIISDQSTRQTYTFFGNGDGTFQAGIVAAPVAGSLGCGGSEWRRQGRFGRWIGGHSVSPKFCWAMETAPSPTPTLILAAGTS